MALAPGMRLGPYEVIAPLGAGGMGEVWRARDARLGRDVAIKVLPAALAGDQERRARFERECRLLASLNHPHVASVLGLEDAGGAPALVMELVEGPTLADRLAKEGALAVPEALALARQIAEAVEYAHERGIVHRDLKPGNVKLTTEGAVKVLDFGLAKALAPDESSLSAPAITQSPTMTLGTHVGVLLGTAAYMSPEQARGKPVDRRADIWAFGALLFEMLTGRQAFAGETVSDTIARILERAPEWDTLPARTPRRVRELLERCLEKDAKRRLRDMGDARLDLEVAIASVESGAFEAPAAGATMDLRRFAIMVTAVALVALGGGYALRAAQVARDATPLRVSLVPPDEIVLTTMMFGQGGDRAIYASGNRRDAAGNVSSAVYRRALDGFEWREVPGSADKLGWDLSLDGRWLYLVMPVAEGSRDLELRRLALDGSSPPTRLMPWDDSRAAWETLPDGRIVTVERGQKRYAILPANADGPPDWRELRCEYTLGTLQLEESLADGRTVLVTAGYYDTTGWVLSAGVLDVERGRVTILERDTGSPQLMPGGRMLMTRNGALLAAPWDARNRRLAAPPVAVMQGLRTRLAWEHAQVRSSPAGDIVVALGGATAQQRHVAIVHRDGREEPWSPEHRLFENAPAPSPDGRFAAVVGVPPGRSLYEVLLLERGRPGARRFASADGQDCRTPSFSPDGRTLAWMRQGGDSAGGLYRAPLDGSEPARRFLPARSLSDMDDIDGWYPDGRSLLVTSYDGRHACVRRVELDGDRARTSDVVRETFNTWSAALSPDGRRIAYLSDETGRTELFVATLQPDGRAGTPVPVSRDHAVRPQWTDGGATLLWSTRARVVLAARVSPTLDVSAPERWLDLAGVVSAPDDFTALPGGALLVTRKAEGEDEIRRLDLVLGFGRELERVMKRARASR